MAAIRHWSEPLVREYLEDLGWRCLAQNYYLRSAELDLVMCDEQGVTVFVEVKQRSNQNFAAVEYSISPIKMRHLQQAALHFLINYYRSEDIACRFDAVFVVGTQDRYSVTHLKNII